MKPIWTGALQSSLSFFFSFDLLAYLCRLMEELLKQIKDYRAEIEAFNASDDKAVEEFRIKWLGTKGLVKNLMGEMKNVSHEKKKEFGQILNEFKQLTESKYEELKLLTSNFKPQTSNNATSNCIIKQ